MCSRWTPLGILPTMDSNSIGATGTTLDSRFSLRSCPCCGSKERCQVFDLPLDAFCRANWSYASDYADVLALEGDARFPIARCSNCGFLYAELEPSATFLTLLYDRVVRHDSNRQAAEGRASVARRMAYVGLLLELAPPDRALTALDFGCGLGTTLRLLVAAGVTAIGYDVSAVRRSYVEHGGLRIAATCDEVIANGPFDIVVCDNVLEHMPNPTGTIELLASVMAEEGLLYVSVPDCDDTFIQTQLRLSGNGQPIDMSLNPLEHLNYFDIAHLDRLLSEGGFLPVVGTELPGQVNIGLRPDPSLRRRLNNSIASTFRLARYALTGQTVRTVTQGFYRRSRSSRPCAR
jgi:SAM-dependent methyltransferase